jgi:uncharacterized phage-associated protein
MSYDALSIANYFLERARLLGESLDHMKVQELVYLANGEHIAIKGQPLINDQVEAWRYGPVIPSLHHAFHPPGDPPFDLPATYLVPPGLEVRLEVTSPEAIEDVVPTIDAPSAPDHDFVRALLDRVWQTYGSYTGIELSNMTHEPGSPWDQINTKYGGHIPKQTDIPVELMREHFLRLARRETAGE